MTLDLFADIACPWCSVGEAHLQHALSTWEGPVDVRWRPFQLQPQLPAEGLPWAAFAASKFGSGAQAQAAYRHVEAAGERAGVAFRFDRLASAPNTADAHRLVLWAETQGRALPLARALFAAYFEHGSNLGDSGRLGDVAEAAGLDGEAARAVLTTEAFRDEVAASQREAARLGIQGVPFYVLDGRLGVSGAQPPEVLLQALAQVAERTPEAG
jgi:predicted DsbA family dithiol-disulfide isomerase